MEREASLQDRSRDAWCFKDYLNMPQKGTKRTTRIPGLILRSSFCAFCAFLWLPIDLDQSTAIAKRRLRGFDHVHHSQPCWSICLWLLVVLDAVDEVQRLGLQRFGVVESRRPHVARSITHQQSIDVFWTRRDADALVVNF